MFNRMIVAAALLGCVSATTAHAVTVASWNTAGLAGTEASVAALAGPAGVTGLALARGAGLTGSGAANSISATGWNSQATDYFSFGFNVTSGFTVALTDLSLGTRSSATGPGTMGLFYSGNGFASALATFDQSPGANFVNTVVNLSALNALTGNVEFRLMAIGTNSANGGTTAGTGTFRVTNFFGSAGDTGSFGFTGTVVAPATAAIPLPAAGWLFVVGLTALATGARRRA